MEVGQGKNHSIPDPGQAEAAEELKGKGPGPRAALDRLRLGGTGPPSRHVCNV